MKILNRYFDKFETPSSNEYDELERIEKRVYADVYDIRRFIKDKYIIVGDIHGCYDEFMELLDKCDYQDGDTVISVGDLIDRGSHSRKVLEWFVLNDGLVVEGNHDNRFRLPVVTDKGGPIPTQRLEIHRILRIFSLPGNSPRVFRTVQTKRSGCPRSSSGRRSRSRWKRQRPAWYFCEILSMYVALPRCDSR